MNESSIKRIGKELEKQLETADKVVVPYSRWKRWADSNVIQDIADIGGICFSGKVGHDLTFFHYP